MKKTILFPAFLLLGMSGWGQKNTSIVNNKETIHSKFEVKQLSLSKWNTKDGIPYVQVPGANLGATSFEILDKNRVAFLCNATSEIIITDRNTGKATQKFSVIYSPRDFIYDDEFFFVLGERQVNVYDTNGKEINKFTFPIDYYGRAGKLTRFDNATYLLLGSGNSLKIESGGITIKPLENEGWITSKGLVIKTQVNGDSSYSVKVIKRDGKIFNKIFNTNKKAAGIFVVGNTENRIVLDVQTFISENPISIERTVVSINLQETDLGSIISSIKIPDCYYVLSNKELYMSANGNIMNMVTTPQGVYILSLTETKSKVSKGYPESLITTKYHFNNHLLQMDNK